MGTAKGMLGPAKGTAKGMRGTLRSTDWSSKGSEELVHTCKQA